MIELKLKKEENIYSLLNNINELIKNNYDFFNENYIFYNDIKNSLLFFDYKKDDDAIIENLKSKYIFLNIGSLENTYYKDHDNIELDKEELKQIDEDIKEKSKDIINNIIKKYNLLKFDFKLLNYINFEKEDKEEIENIEDLKYEYIDDLKSEKVDLYDLGYYGYNCDPIDMFIHENEEIKKDLKEFLLNILYYNFNDDEINTYINSNNKYFSICYYEEFKVENFKTDEAFFNYINLINFDDEYIEESKRIYFNIKNYNLLNKININTIEENKNNFKKVKKI